LRAIDQALVDEVWRDLVHYPPERVRREADAFLEQQPDVAAFCRGMTEALDPAVQHAALGIGFLLFKILEVSLGRPFPPLAPARIHTAYASIESTLQGGDADPAELLRRLDDPAHPSLTAHILSVFYHGTEAAPAGKPAGDYDEQVKASLALLLETLTTALDVGRVEGG
jgi:hypothetical protein